VKRFLVCPLFAFWNPMLCWVETFCGREFDSVSPRQCQAGLAYPVGGARRVRRVRRVRRFWGGEGSTGDYGRLRRNTDDGMYLGSS